MSPEEKRYRTPGPRISCKTCGKVVAASGMLGHMRWSHSPEAEANRRMFREGATRMPEILEPSSLKREKLFQLITELNRVREELKKAKESDRAWIFTDPDNDAAITALEAEKARIGQQIRELKESEEP